jgi:mycothiol synthase
MTAADAGVSPLPPNYTTRPPTRADAPAVAVLIAHCQRAEGDAADTTTADVLGDWDGLALAEDAVLVLAPDGQLVGCADILNRRFVTVSVYGYVAPEHTRRGVGGWLVAWGEAWTRNRMERAPDGARVVTQHYLLASNAPARQLLAARGYVLVRTYYRMGVTLTQPPDVPQWPVGVRVRAFRVGHDEHATFDTVEDAFRDIWNRPPGTFERFRQMTQAAEFDPAFWLLAENEHGKLVGVCLSKVVAGRGSIDALGVRRSWRGRGLGGALLRAAIAALYARGVHEVGLSVDAQSGTSAPRVYLRAGMRVLSEYVLFQKELRAAASL